MTGLQRSWRIQDRPPERFHAFLSYTTREDEVRAINPLLDRFLNHYLRPSIEAALGEPPIFYDGWYLRNEPSAIRNEYSLQRALRSAIEESEMLLAFVSPLYVQSSWCLFEVETMARKAPRPWCDICRKVPNDELLDRRQSHVRPSPWECLMAALARRIWKPRAPRIVESPIVPIVWKGDCDLLASLPLSPGRHVLDWRGCGRYVEWGARIAHHRSHHGSVSPSWEAEMEVELQRCEKAMSSTAKTVVDVLQDRREAYRKSPGEGQSRFRPLR